jgi:glycosyltransferase involved in cell wall biosynthesis
LRLAIAEFSKVVEHLSTSPAKTFHNSQRMTGGLTLGVLSRDEAAKLDRCLASMRPFVDEIVVLDSGSVDDSVAVAKKHGATVYEIEWPKNWSIAHNMLAAKIQTSWTVRLDQDEWFDAAQARDLRELTRHDQVCGYYIVRRDLIAADSDKYDEIHLLRLWRTHEKVYFERAMHEVLRHARFEEAWPGKVLLRSDVYFWHDGHIGQEISKGQRNVEYLRADLLENPGDIITRAYLATTLNGIGDPEGKVELETLINDILDPAFVGPPPGQTALAFAMHMELIPTERALEPRTDFLIRKALEWFPENPVILFYAAVLERKRGDFDRALVIFLKLEKMADSGEYDRAMSIPLEFLGERLWKSLGFIATKLGRDDIVRRCQRRLAQHS